MLILDKCVLVAQLCLILCDPMDCSLPGSSVPGILQARILEWVAVPFSRGSFQLRDPTLQADYLPSEPPGKPTRFTMNVLSFLLEKRRKTRANQVQTKKKKSVSCSVVSDSLQSHGL